MLSGRWRTRTGLAAELLLQAVAIVVIAAPGQVARRQQDDVPTTGVPKKGASWREILTDPIKRPGVVAAQDAGLPPDEMVIGVMVGGKARAYRLEAMEGRSKHLVNDLVAGVPVSVAYCNVTGCVRGYTGPPGPAPLDLAVAGLLNDEMVLNAGGSLYFQGSGKLVDPALLESSHNPIAVAHAHNARKTLTANQGTSGIPYDTLTPVLTTWQAWVEQHPDSDIYTGIRPEESSASRGARAP
jgi:Protein of unknown function (DUF3179)